MTKDAIYEAEFNCDTTELDGGVPPEVDDTGKAIPNGTLVYVWDKTKTPKEIVSIFKMVDGIYGKIGGE